MVKPKMRRSSPAADDEERRIAIRGDVITCMGQTPRTPKSVELVFASRPVPRLGFQLVLVKRLSRRVELLTDSSVCVDEGHHTLPQPFGQ
jgi:hypothetical protein